LLFLEGFSLTLFPHAWIQRLRKRMAADGDDVNPYVELHDDSVAANGLDGIG
jgi:hypothetical protein